MWLLRDVEKSRSLMEWSLQEQQGEQDSGDSENAAAEPVSPRSAGRPSVKPSTRPTLSRASAQQRAASSPTEPTSAAERLTQLRQLVDAGLLTDAEYEEKRQGIVSAL